MSARHRAVFYLLRMVLKIRKIEKMGETDGVIRNVRFGGYSKPLQMKRLRGIVVLYTIKTMTDRKSTRLNSSH